MSIPEPKTTDSSPNPALKNARSLWTSMTTLGVRLSSALIGIAFLFLLLQSLMSATISIEPISVPKALTDSGYTADVAAQRLRDALAKFLESAHSEMRAPGIALQGELPKIV